MKTCFFTRAGGRTYAQSEKQRTEKSPAACLGLSEAPLQAVPRTTLPGQRALGQGESHDPLLPEQHLAGALFPTPSTEHGQMVLEI